MQVLIADTLLALRTLWKRQIFSWLTVLMLALGIAGATSMYSIVQAILLERLPVTAPERLVDLGWRYQQGRVGMSHAQFTSLRDEAVGIGEPAASTTATYTLNAAQGAQRIRVHHVSWNFHRVLGISPAVGREFMREDDVESASATVIGAGFARRHYGSVEAALGAELVLDDTRHRVVGVLPDSYARVSPVEVHLPLMPVAASIGQGSNYTVIARLRDDLSLAQAGAMFAARSNDLFDQPPSPELQPELLGYMSARTLGYAEPIGLMVAAVAILLTIVLANFANLLVLRGLERQRELAVRIAVGADRVALARNLLLEGLVLATAAALLALPVAQGLLHLLWELRGNDFLWQGVQLSWSSMLFALACAWLVALCAGVPSILASSRPAIAPTLKTGGAGAIASGTPRLRELMVALQVALALVLLLASSLVLDAFTRLRNIDPGFAHEQLLAIPYWTGGTRHQRSSETVAALAEEMARQARELPGVEASAVVAMGLPLATGGNFPFHLAGQAEPYNADLRAVSPGYFETLGVAQISGRSFSGSDLGNSARVAIVNQAFARIHFGQNSPLGQRIILANQDFAIVGVVADVRSSLTEAAPATLYLSLAQTPIEILAIFEGWFPLQVLARTSVDPAALKPELEQTLRAHDSSVPVGAAQTLKEVFALAHAEQSFQARLLGAFALPALVLVIAGTYGSLSQWVESRRREYGVALALGALPSQVLQSTLLRGLRTSILGIVVGSIAAMAFARMVQSAVIGIEAITPSQWLAVTAILVSAALAAAFIPARRAARLSPTLALRQDWGEPG